MIAAVIVCQALDGRWHFGPAEQRAGMEGDDFGTYETAEEAAAAARARGLTVADDAGGGVNAATIKHSPAIGEFAVLECGRLRAENARLREALRTNAQQPFNPSDNGERWDEGYKRGFQAALNAVYEQNRALLLELGEAA